MKLISAIALDRPREVSTRFGPRLVIDCLNRDTNEKFPIWRGVDSKGKFNLIEDPALTNLGQPLPTEPVPVKPVSRYLASNNPPIPNYSQNSEKTSESDQSLLNPNQKREIANYVQEMAKLYKYCLDQVETTIGVEGEDRRAIATTLYLSAQKKFAL